jgi:hypothetical protein
MTEQIKERDQKPLGTSCGANVTPAATATAIWETTEGKRGPSQNFSIMLSLNLSPLFSRGFPLFQKRA